MNYIILIKSEAAALAAAVNEKINEGYRPLGGVSVAMTQMTHENSRKGYVEYELEVTYAQAMMFVDQ